METLRLMCQVHDTLGYAICHAWLIRGAEDER